MTIGGTRIYEETVPMTELSTLSPEDLARLIDHTFLKAFGPPADIDRLCAEAREYGFACVMVNPSEIERCRALLGASRVPIGVTIGFPLGQSTAAVKDFECRDAVQRGARELDMVLNVRALQAGALSLVRSELQSLVRVCADAGAESKLILETCYLSDTEKKTACLMARDAGVRFVKTSTGLGAGGATIADIRLMRETVGSQMGVKASGGIRDLDTALAMLAAGANRIGTSSGVALVQELRRRRSQGL